MRQVVSASVQAFAAGDLSRYAAAFGNAGFTTKDPAPGILQVRRAIGSAAPIRLLLSVGIHGDETAPIEILAGLLDALAGSPHALQTELMVVVGNPAAIAQGRRFIDGDLNRMFQTERGDLRSACEAARADAIMNATSDFFAGEGVKWHLDLHTAIRPSFYPTFAVVPDVIPEPGKQSLLDWLGQAGVEAAILNSRPSGTYSAYSARHCQALSATIELGQVSALGNNDLSRFGQTSFALDTLLRSGAPATATASAGPRPLLFRLAQELTRHSERFHMVFERDTKNFTPIPPGELIATDGDIVYRAGDETEYVVFPNPDVHVGLRAGLMVTRVPE